MVWQCGGVSTYESLDNSLHMTCTPCRRFCGKFVANVYDALKANWFVLDRSAGLSHGGLVGGNCV